MKYPFTALFPQLQFLCTPAEYTQILSPLARKWGAFPPQKEDYWRIIPAYIYAYCPICRFPCREQADTYSLRVWGGANNLRDALFSIAQWHLSPLPRCLHFLGIAKFYNLHNQTPDELDWFQQETGEVPVVTPWLLPDDIESYVVLHALPICRIENNQFAPRYTVFVLTYFSQNPPEVLRRVYSEESADPEYLPAVLVTSKFPGPSLAEWAARGKLGWLDLTQPDLPLRIGKGAQLPEIYHNIQGSLEKYRWKIPGTSYR